MVDFLEARGVQDASVLDIGFGIGALHLELLKRNADHVTGVEVVETSENLTPGLAEELGFSDNVDYRLGDFALMPAEVPESDILVLDRAVCCHPDWEGLVRPSAQHARRLYGLVLPVDTWYAPALFGVANIFFRLFRLECQSHLHPRGKIDAAINAAGLTRAFTARKGIWESMGFRARECLNQRPGRTATAADRQVSSQGLRPSAGKSRISRGGCWRGCTPVGCGSARVRPRRSSSGKLWRRTKL